MIYPLYRESLTDQSLNEFTNNPKVFSSYLSLWCDVNGNNMDFF